MQKKVHVKKPLNAFMLYMKEMRSKVISECTLKESDAINQILGKRVSHFLSRFRPFVDFKKFLKILIEP
jgi:hypothetical protein